MIGLIVFLAPFMLSLPSPHATDGRENLFSIGAQRHLSRTGAFFTPSVRLFNGGLGEAVVRLAGIQYAGFSPSFSPSPIRREKRTRRLQTSVLESIMKFLDHGQVAPEASLSPAHLPDLSHRFLSVQRGEPITNPNDLCDNVWYTVERAAGMIECLAELYANDRKLASALDAVRFEVMDIAEIVEAWRKNAIAASAESDRKEPDHE
jgi:hypothetical protein